MRAVSPAIAAGAVVFLFSLGTACWAGYQAHNMTNEDRPLDQEFDEYQALTIVCLIIASVGIGMATYGLVFENHENDARKIPKYAIVIGVTISALGFGTALWAALVTVHMEVLQNHHYSEYQAIGRLSSVGFWVGSLGVVITAYAFSSSARTHASNRQNINMLVAQCQLPHCPYCRTLLIPGSPHCPGCARPVKKRKRKVVRVSPRERP